MAGYQRELESRHEKITEFLQQDSTNNIIPNSVIVAIDLDALTIEDTESRSTEAQIAFFDHDFDTGLKALIEEFESRLSPEELESIALIESDETSEDADADPVTPPDSYLAELTKQLRDFRDSPDSFDTTKAKIVKEFVSALTKPGLIIDGQHRVFGAKEVTEFDVEFPVVLIPGLEFSEQVFHFYVLNNKAKPLNRTHLRRIISTTLSKKEIGRLYDRLKDAGVEAKSAEWTHRMNNDQVSPFKGLIDMGLQESQGAINENVAYQLISRFMSLHSRYRGVPHEKLTVNRLV